MRGASPVVVFDRVSVRYAGAPAPALRRASFTVEEGELALVVGRTGSGKSTLLGAVNGTVPHFSGGLLSGRVTVVGRDTRTHRPRDLADVVGVVGQDPVRGFVTDTVEEELAYTLEQLALPSDVMRRRVEETLDLLGIADLRDAPLRDLSGGEQQRVAIGAVLTAHPSVLVLDEPTSALDPGAAEDVLATLSRLVHDHGLTVLLAEHRVERVVGFADRVVHVSPTGEVIDGTPAEVMRSSSIVPPLVELGRWAGWEPLPMTVRDARRAAGPFREALPEHPHPTRDVPAGPVLLEAQDVTVTHTGLDAVRWVDTTLQAGSVCALMGRNGAGKSSLLWALQGTGPRSAGTVTVHTADGVLDPASVAAARRRALVGLVPQSASDLLHLETVGAECAQADSEAGAEPGTCRALLEELAPGIPADRHPRDLSEGQRLALVVCVQLTAAPRVMLLDEPTRGLDYPAKAALARFLRRLTDDGAAVAVATHDVEFAAVVADRVVVMADGHVVADGPAADVLCGSPAFAPQVAKVLAPAAWLTVEQVRTAAEVARR